MVNRFQPEPLLVGHFLLELDWGGDSSAPSPVGEGGGRGFFFGRFMRPLLRRASAMIHCSWPFVERNSSAAQASMASNVAASMRRTNDLVVGFFSDMLLMNREQLIMNNGSAGETGPDALFIKT